MYKEYEFYVKTRVIHKAGALKDIGSIVRRLGVPKVMLIYDEGILKAGLVAPCLDSLAKDGIDVVEFGEVKVDPPMYIVEKAAETAKKEKAGAVIALGGGSTIDTAKVARMLVNNPGKCRDYTVDIGKNLFKNKGLPLICIPTTAGTGSEVTFSSVLTDTDINRKIAVRDEEKMYADYAILDPEVTVSMPPEVTNATGMDALAHAVEAYLKPNATPYSDSMCLHAIRMIYENLSEAYRHPDNIEARDNMLLASNLAMCGVACIGLQIGHGMGQAMGAYTHAPHGAACTWALPCVIEHLAGELPDKIRNIAGAMGAGAFTDGCGKDAKGFVLDAIRRLASKIHIPTIQSYGVTMEKDYEKIVEFVWREQRLCQASARAFTKENAEEYVAAIIKGEVI